MMKALAAVLSICLILTALWYHHAPASLNGLNYKVHPKSQVNGPRSRVLFPTASAILPELKDIEGIAVFDKSQYTLQYPPNGYGKTGLYEQIQEQYSVPFEYKDIRGFDQNRIKRILFNGLSGIILNQSDEDSSTLDITYVLDDNGSELTITFNGLPKSKYSINAPPIPSDSFIRAP